MGLRVPERMQFPQNPSSAENDDDRPSVTYLHATDISQGTRVTTGSFPFRDRNKASTGSALYVGNIRRAVGEDVVRDRLSTIDGGRRHIRLLVS